MRLFVTVQDDEIVVTVVAVAAEGQRNHPRRSGSIPSAILTTNSNREPGCGGCKPGFCQPSGAETRAGPGKPTGACLTRDMVGRS